MLPDCSELPDWVLWIAQDADGAWWAYEHEPNMYDSGWYENELGRRMPLHKNEPNRQWRQEVHIITKSNQ